MVGRATTNEDPRLDTTMLLFVKLLPLDPTGNNRLVSLSIDQTLKKKVQETATNRTWNCTWAILCVPNSLSIYIAFIYLCLIIPFPPTVLFSWPSYHLPNHNRITPQTLLCAPPLACWRPFPLRNILLFIYWSFWCIIFIDFWLFTVSTPIYYLLSAPAPFV